MIVSDELKSSVISEAKDSNETEIKLIRMKTQVQEFRLNCVADKQFELASEIDDCFEKLKKLNRQKQNVLDKMVDLLINGLPKNDSNESTSAEMGDNTIITEDVDKTSTTESRSRNKTNKLDADK